MKRLFYSLFALLIAVGCARTISDLILKIGDGTDADVKIEMELGKGASNPYLNYDTANDKFQFCNEGASCEDMGSGSGGGVPLLAKGSLLTSDGASNGEFTACADDEIIVWDAAETNGFKCEAKPSGGGGPVNYVIGPNVNNYFTSSSGFGNTGLTVTITTGGNPVQVWAECHPGATICGNYGNASGQPEMRILRNGSVIKTAVKFQSNAREDSNMYDGVKHFDVQPAGTYTYTVQMRDTLSNGVGFYQLRLIAREL